MRQGPNKPRMRGRTNNRNRPGFHRNQSFDSNGPDVKVRGSAQQIVEKYLALARDATAAGDRIAAESYCQHAEHYYRILNASAGEGRGQAPAGDHPANGASPPADAEAAAAPRRRDGGEDPGARPQPQAAPAGQDAGA